MKHSHPSESTPTIRPAQVADAPEISTLILASVDYFHTEHYPAEAIDSWRKGYAPHLVEQQVQKGGSWVLAVSDELAGIIQFEVPEIKGFYIHPRFSGQGFGSLLLQHMLTQVVAQGHSRVELTSNPQAAPFYLKYGFQHVGQEVVPWEGYDFLEYRMVLEPIVLN
ncbi:MAG TPA: hypothetical protein DCE41_29400 [Cytophagales bacterium]|nr:hypothetical protein [Cytophagales bacterium]HAA17414.1 hypothetical protein [Cytophagales bacterium]HAP58565.1 hypothetical protein [Cytophagales bacterium]